MAAPVPRPPQPMTPMRITSEPAAQRPPEPATAATSVAMEAAEAVLMKSLRVSPLSSIFLLLFKMGIYPA